MAGLCFGLAYGLTQRLVSLNVADLIRFGQGFDVQVFPGTSYESLKLRFGAAEAELRGNLELQQLERQQAAEKAAEKAADQGADAKPAPEAEDLRPDALLDPDPLPAEPAAPERPAPEPAAAGRPAPPPAPQAPAAPPPAPGQ